MNLLYACSSATTQDGRQKLNLKALKISEESDFELDPSKLKTQTSLGNER